MNNFTNRLNNAANAFAAVATMFLPLGVIAGIFGMNVRVPWQEIDAIWPFWALCGIMAAIFIIIFIALKIKKMI